MCPDACLTRTAGKKRDSWRMGSWPEMLLESGILDEKTTRKRALLLRRRLDHCVGQTVVELAAAGDSCLARRLGWGNSVRSWCCLVNASLDLGRHYLASDCCRQEFLR